MRELKLRQIKKEENMNEDQREKKSFFVWGFKVRESDGLIWCFLLTGSQLIRTTEQERLHLVRERGSTIQHKSRERNQSEREIDYDED